MKDEYLIVHKSALPDYYDKVLEARELLQSGKARDVSEAAQMAGISRSTYYKYRDLIFRASGADNGRKAVFSMLLTHRKGVLSQVLAFFSSIGANVVTVMQNPPLGTRASLVIAVDTSGMSLGITEVLEQLNEMDGVAQAGLMDFE